MIEAWGRGTLKIIEECQKAQLPSPLFENNLDGFNIEFKKSSGKSSDEIIKLMASNTTITIPKIASILDISTRAVEKQISKLKEENKIKRVDSARAGHWKVTFNAHLQPILP